MDNAHEIDARTHTHHETAIKSREEKQKATQQETMETHTTTSTRATQKGGENGRAAKRKNLLKE